MPRRSDNLGDLDRVIGCEVPTGNETEDVVAVQVGPGDPARAVGHSRIGEVADARCRFLAQQRAGGRPRADVSLNQAWRVRVGLEGEKICVGCSLDGSRSEGDFGTFHVDVAITGQTDDDDLACAVEVGEGENDVLEGVRGGPRPAIRSRVFLVRDRDQCGNGRGVRRRENFGGSQLLVGASRGRQGRERLDIRGVSTVGTDEGVLPDRGRVQEFFAARPAHRAGVGLDDHVFEPEAGEDALVGVSLFLVAEVEPGIRVVEGVGILHRELATPQQPGTGAGLITIFVLDLVNRQGQILV